MTFIIAEAGINHNGILTYAKELAKVSYEAGADAVKFQSFWNMGRLKEYELTLPETEELYDYCYQDAGIEFMTTPHTLEAIDIVDPFVKRHKIASPFLTNKEFIQKIDEKGKPIYLSTGSLKNEDGMATLKEIDNALGWIKNCDVTLLHCVSKYPCKDPKLQNIFELRSFFSNVKVGLSDHSMTMAYDINLPVLEKHIMLQDVNGIDENVSLNPAEFKMMVDYIRGKENE